MMSLKSTNIKALSLQILKTIASLLIVIAIAGVGMNTRFSSMKKIGLKPFYVGLAASIIMGGLSYALIKCLGMG